MYEKLRLQHTTREETYYMSILNIQLSTCLFTGAAPLLPDRKIAHPFQLNGLSAKVKAILLNLLGIKNLCTLYKNIFRMKRPH